jgi:hypothetical protein
MGRVLSATNRAWACQDAEPEAETAALDAAGGCVAPTMEELCGLGPDPLADPPSGPDEWLADLPGPLLDEYLSVPAEPARPEPLAAGFRDRAAGDGCGFAAGGACDKLPPGPVLAELTDRARAAGLDTCTDDGLIGVMRAARRLASWSAALELSAVGELMHRRLEQQAAGHTRVAEHADDEVAAALTLTSRAAGRVLDLAMALRRLPGTAGALAAGVIDLPRAAVIADETSGLSDEHAAAVEDHVLARVASQTTGQLRAATRRAALAADPRAAHVRRERAQQDARVERWDEQAGTAALAGRDLPPAGVLAADQHLSALARSLRQAGVAGTADQLRAKVFLALLTGQPATSLLGSGNNGAHLKTGFGHRGHDGPGDQSDDRSGNPDAPSFLDELIDNPGGAGVSGGVLDGGPGGSGWPGIGVVAGRINLTMPLASWVSLSASPGEVAGFGPLSAEDSRALAAAMAGHPMTRCCLTLTGTNGHPVAHGCARPGHRLPGSLPGAGPEPRPPPARSSPHPYSATRPGIAAESGADAQADARTDAGADAGAGAGTLAAWMSGIALRWLAADECTHPGQSTVYRPPPLLRHLIGVRQRACAFPGCRRPASRCDLDHTTPYEHGGRTCECNLAPLCRKHHQAKQAHGWRLEQPRPGVLVWTMPSGRTYTTQPTTYPV